MEWILLLPFAEWALVLIVRRLWKIGLWDIVPPLSPLICLYVGGLTDEDTMRGFWIVFSGYVFFFIIEQIRRYVRNRKRSINRYENL